MLQPTHFTFLGQEILPVGAWLVLACGLIPTIAGYLFRAHRVISPVLLFSNAVLWVVSEQTIMATLADVCPRKARDLQEAGGEIFVGSFECAAFELDLELLAKLLIWMLPAFLLGWAAAETRFRLGKRKSANS